jgi:hypothetical protein
VVLAPVALPASANTMGRITGVVRAGGGLGDFVPPPVMGSPHGAHGSDALGPVLLARVVAGALFFIGIGVRRALMWRVPAAWVRRPANGGGPHDV